MHTHILHIHIVHALIVKTHKVHTNTSAEASVPPKGGYIDFGHAISTFFKKSPSEVRELGAKLRLGKTSAKARSKNSKIKFLKNNICGGQDPPFRKIMSGHL